MTIQARNASRRGICILAEGRELIERRIRTEPARFAAVLGGRPRARIVIEASTDSEWVARCLEALGHEVIVADPNFAPMYATRTRKVKTDSPGRARPGRRLSARRLPSRPSALGSPASRGQRIEVGNSDATSFTVGAGTFDRMRNPAVGRSGGRPGRPGAARLASGKELATKAVHTVPPGDRIVVELPGGGGVGDPARRAKPRIDADVAAGLVSADGVARDYGAGRGGVPQR